MYRDDPQQHVQELLNATLWPNQPLGRAITGTAATLGRMSRRHLTGYLRENYVTQATVLVAAGRVKHRHAMRAGARLARRLQAGRRATFAPVLVGRTGPRVKLFTRKIEQTHLALGFRACSRHDPRHHALRLLNTILGENMSSRLFQIVREDRGLAYSIYSTPSFFADAGDLVVSAGLDAENLPKTLPLILRELRRCAKTAPSPAELRRARDYVRGQIDLGSESTDYQMNWLGEQWLGYGHIQSPEETKRRLSSVTPSQIRAIAESVFRPENLHMAMVSPWKDEKAVLAMLKF